MRKWTIITVLSGLLLSSTAIGQGWFSRGLRFDNTPTNGNVVMGVDQYFVRDSGMPAGSVASTSDVAVVQAAVVAESNRIDSVGYYATNVAVLSSPQLVSNAMFYSSAGWDTNDGTALFYVVGGMATCYVVQAGNQYAVIDRDVVLIAGHTYGLYLDVDTFDYVYVAPTGPNISATVNIGAEYHYLTMNMASGGIRTGFYGTNFTMAAGGTANVRVQVNSGGTPTEWASVKLRGIYLYDLSASIPLYAYTETDPLAILADGTRAFSSNLNGGAQWATNFARYYGLNGDIGINMPTSGKMQVNATNYFSLYGQGAAKKFGVQMDQVAPYFDHCAGYDTNLYILTGAGSLDVMFSGNDLVVRDTGSPEFTFSSTSLDGHGNIFSNYVRSIEGDVHFANPADMQATNDVWPLFFCPVNTTIEQVWSMIDTGRVYGVVAFEQWTNAGTKWTYVKNLVNQSNGPSTVMFSTTPTNLVVPANNSVYVDLPTNYALSLHLMWRIRR